MQYNVINQHVCPQEQPCVHHIFPQWVHNVSTVYPQYGLFSVHCVSALCPRCGLRLLYVHRASLLCPPSHNCVYTDCPQFVNHMSTMCPLCVNRVSTLCPPVPPGCSAGRTVPDLPHGPGLCPAGRGQHLLLPLRRLGVHLGRGHRERETEVDGGH